MYKISIVGIQLHSGFMSEIEFIAPSDTADETAVLLLDTGNYEIVAMEVEYVDAA